MVHNETENSNSSSSFDSNCHTTCIEQQHDHFLFPGQWQQARYDDS